jgi:ribonuclease HII
MGCPAAGIEDSKAVGEADREELYHRLTTAPGVKWAA